MAERSAAHEILTSGKQPPTMGAKLALLVRDVLSGLGAEGVAVDFTRTENPMFGDYSTNVALVAAKSLKTNPRELAGKIAAGLKDPAIAKVDVAGPGFINVFLSDTALFEALARSSGAGEPTVAALTGSTGGQGKKVMVEFTDPNPFKELHIGHLYSNSVGESLSRLLTATGNTVKRVDYFGDVGMHVAKSLYGLRKLMEDGSSVLGLGSWEGKDKKPTIKDLEALPLEKRVHALGAAYALGASAYEEDKAAAEDIKDINYYVYLAGQKHMRELVGWEPQVDYKQYIPNFDQKKADEIQELYDHGRKWSMAYFETIFTRLGTTFDYYDPESITGEYGFKLVMEYLGKGVFEKNEGAVVFRGEKFGLHTRVFVNSLGLPTYETKELGLAWKKDLDEHPDLSLIVTGNEINEYFRVLMAAMGQIFPDIAAKTVHVGHGMVRLPEGKMSSRTGKVITGEWLLEEVKTRVVDVLSTGRGDYTPEEKADIAEKVSIAAVKYSMLRVGLPSDITFDFVKSISFDGDSGPYLQYTYARAKSVIRKAEGGGQKAEGGGQKAEKDRGSSVLGLGNSDIGHGSSKDLRSTIEDLNPEERAVLRLMAFFPEVILEASENLSPNVLTTYLFGLASAFNLLYAKHQIVGVPEEPFRLALTAAAANVIRQGLFLLGIPVIERM